MEFAFISQKVNILPGPWPRCLRPYCAPGCGPGCFCPVSFLLAALDFTANGGWWGRTQRGQASGLGWELGARQKLCEDSLWGVGKSVPLPEPQPPNLEKENPRGSLSCIAALCSKGGLYQTGASSFLFRLYLLPASPDIGQNSGLGSSSP